MLPAPPPPLVLYQHQVEGVKFLVAAPRNAMLFDEQRVGKTATAITAAGQLSLNIVLVITTVAGVGVWKQQIPQWNHAGVIFVVIPWSQIVAGGKYTKDLTRHYDLVIFDESHYAKNPTAQRTQRAFGRLYGDKLLPHQALISKADRIWCLSGTPMGHDPGDLFMTLKALFPHILDAWLGMPDVSTFQRFRRRYCVIQLRRYGKRMIEVVVRGQNLDELKRRIAGLFLRRRQKDVGIRPAFWSTLPLPLSPRDAAELESHIDRAALDRALAKGQFTEVERHLAQVRRVTGMFKAKPLVKLVAEYMETYPGEKLVLFYWHTSVGTLLEEGLAKYMPVRVDGGVVGEERTRRVARFSRDPAARLFIGQIAACGEAIDLSASSEAWFVESVFTPSQMAQAGARITNLTQPHQCLVRVAALQDSVDELIQDRLVDLSRSIAHTLGESYVEDFRQHQR